MSDDETTARDIASKFADNRFIDELERAIMAYGNDWARAARNAALEQAATLVANDPLLSNYSRRKLPDKIREMKTK
jgi:hypothetical protein